MDKPTQGPRLSPSNNFYLGIIPQLLAEHGAALDAVAHKDEEIIRQRLRAEKGPDVLNALEWAKAEVARIKSGDHVTPEMTAHLETLIAYAER